MAKVLLLGTLFMALTFTAPAGAEKPAAEPKADLPAPESLRDPFWPVGYAPAGTAGPRAEKKEGLLDLSRLSPEEQAIIKSHLRVGGILEQRGRRVAIINSDVVKEGDVMKLNVSGATYRFLIRSLQPQNIVLEPIQEEEKPEPQE